MSMIQYQIERLRRLKESYALSAVESKIIADAIDTIETQGAKLAAHNLHDGWIPCSERLPEANQEVLVTEEDSPYVLMCCYEAFYGYGYGFHGSSGKVVAWMPLPEPWKGE